MAPRTNAQFEQIRVESKTKILVAALELFAIDGYHNTSISKIAKHAGISKGLMYNYFESKEELLKEVVLMSLEDAKEVSLEMLKNLEGKEPKEILKLSLEMFFDMLVQNKIMWKLNLSLAMQVSNMPSVTKIITDMFGTFVMEFEMLLQLNGYEDYKTEAKLLAAQLDGISFHFLIFENTYNLEEIKIKLISKYCNT